MERVLKNPPKSRTAATLVAPGANGWRVRRIGDGPVETLDAATLEDAVAVIAQDGGLTMALPASEVLLERMTLPSRERAELEGMVRLQLEKTLPYPVEEITCDFEVIRREGEADSVVLAAGIHTPALEALAAPFRAAGRLPERVTVHAEHMAAACPDGVVLAVFREGAGVVAAICEDRKLSFVQSLGEGEDLQFEVGQMLLTAEMVGAPADFTAVCVAPDCADAMGLLREIFDAPVRALEPAGAAFEGGLNLVPPAWEADEKRLANRQRLRGRLTMAAIVYGVLVLLAVGYVMMLHQRSARLDRDLAEARPRLDELQMQKERWQAMQPAVEPSRFTVEALFQVLKDLPAGVKVTQFEQGLEQFMIEGEASTAAQAISFSESLRKNEALSDYRIESGPPKLLRDDAAQFRIFGKL